MTLATLQPKMTTGARRPEDAPTPGRRCKVLVIDDDPAVRSTLTRALADVYEIQTCASGSEGIALLDHDVHAVILDPRMRGDEGIWTHKAIRKRFDYLPVIFLSSFQDLKDPYEVINAHRPFGYLRKGGDAAELRRLVADAVRQYAVHRRKEMQLLVADRLAAVGTLAAGAAHEINNPLGYIIGNIEYVIEELEELGYVFEQDRLGEISCALTAALDGAQRIARIITDLRSFDRREPRSAASEASVHEVLERATRLAANEIRHRARLVTDYGAVPPVRADSERLSQIFLNLLVNAAHALPLGDAENNEIRVRTFRDGPRNVVIEIHDTGTGIPEDIRDRIFDPFFTTKAPDLGTGLGLFVVHNLVTELGGTIQLVSSSPRTGTTFRVTLPAAVAGTQADEAHALVPLGQGRGRILVIEDEPLVARSLERLLSMCEVTTVDNGATAIELCKQCSFDAILCDVMMPEHGGIEVYEGLKSYAPGMERRIVFISGGVIEPSVAAFLEQVDNPFLEKPIRRDEILRALGMAAGAASAS